MKNQYLKRKLLKEYINIKLREEKEILEEGLMDELKFGIGAFFLSQLGGIGVAGAVSPNQMAKELASNMPGVENVGIAVRWCDNYRVYSSVCQRVFHLRLSFTNG